MERFLRRLLPVEEIREHVHGHGWTGRIYMIRFVLLNLFGFRIYIHKFVRPDHARELHDHPNDFLSLMLKGAYYEWREDGGPKIRTAPSLSFRKAEVFHRIELDSHRSAVRQTQYDDWDRATGTWISYHPCWTIVLMWPHRRKWGFKCPGGKTEWTQYYEQGGCGSAKN